MRHPYRVTDVMVVTVNLYCYVLPEQGYPAVADRHCPALGGWGSFPRARPMPDRARAQIFARAK